MLKFTKLEKDVEFLRPYFEKSNIEFCDLSVGVRFMWREEFNIEYAINNGSLFIKESCRDYSNAFYLPIGENLQENLIELENYVKQNNLPLLFCCLDNVSVATLSNRYPNSRVYNLRDWSDYIYEANGFITYSGKKYNGQRNHVNKFKRLYPNYQFSKITEKDIDGIKDFLAEYERETEVSVWSEEKEREKVHEFIDNMFLLKQDGGKITVDDKIVAISIGERVKDTLVIHIEKGLKTYEGVYPTMANEFAKCFAVNGVKYINREEDCGDMGLRISKLQYHPVEVKEKNLMQVSTLFDRIKEPVLLEENDLVIEEITEKDKEDYKNIYLDTEINKYWGYNYKTDLGNNKPTADYFYSFSKGLKDKKEEYDLKITINGFFAGEICLHNFDYFGSVEIGIRLKGEYQHKGYGKRAVNLLLEYCFNTLKAKRVKMKAYKENTPSNSMIKSLGFAVKDIDETYNYYEIEK